MGIGKESIINLIEDLEGGGKKRAKPDATYAIPSVIHRPTALHGDCEAFSEAVKVTAVDIGAMLGKLNLAKLEDIKHFSQNI